MLEKYFHGSLKAKLIVIFLIVGLVPLIIISLLTLSSTSSALETESFNKLISVRELKKDQIEKYFSQIQDQIITFSENRMIISAMNEFKEAFGDFSNDQNITTNLSSIYEPKVKNYYKNEFLSRLNQNVKDKRNIEPYWPGEPTTSYLQYLYFANNPNPTGEKHKLNNAGDGSKYSQLHEKYHPIIRSFLEKFGYYDIFLVDSETGHIIYSVFKEVDYTTSLLTGPYKNTNFARAFVDANRANDKDYVKLVDFEPYDPSYSAPASFIASPIYDGDKKIGVLLFQMPVDEINRIMLSDQKWVENGLGLSGETYLVADDFRLRTNSRFLIEDKSAYLQALEQSGTTEDILNRIDALETSILFQSFNTLAAEEALSNKTGNQIVVDYRGIPVLSAYAPLKIDGLNWALLAEIDEEEAFAASNDMKLSTLIIGIIISILVVVAGLIFSKSISTPIKEISEAAQKVASGNTNVSVSVKTQDEIGSLALAFNQMVEKIGMQLGYLDRIPTPVMIVDKEFNIEYMNKTGAEVIGKDVKSLIGKKCYDHFKTGDCNTENCAVAKAIKNDNQFTSETISNANNKKTPILYTGTPLKNKEGEIVGALEYVVNTTELKERENYLKRSTKVMQTAMQKFAAGDLTIHVKPEIEDDDIGQLFNSFNQTTQNFKMMIEQVNEAVSATASASTEISSSAEEMAAGAQEQSSQAAEVSDAVKQMSTTILHTTQSASKADTDAKAAGDMAKTGGNIVLKTVEGMSKISEVVSKAAFTVRDLGKSSDKIGEIIQVINDIADQTNLLALNAAIEAARAGEQGRGFAVVADEVRKLAERTTKATQEIAKMITTIQSETKGAVASIDAGTEEVEKGKALAQEAGDSLKDIIEMSSQVVNVINQVATASEEQSSTAEQISRNIESITSVTQQSAAGTQQIARASEDLSNLTNNLQKLVQKFKIDFAEDEFLLPEYNENKIEEKEYC